MMKTESNDSGKDNMVNKENIIVWFRQDLRLTDNPALSHAINTASSSGHIYLVYINETDNSADENGVNQCQDDPHASLGGASKWWLHHSLIRLNESVNHSIHFISGNPKDILSHLFKKWQVGQVVWNRCYEPRQIKRDSDIKQYLKENSVDVSSFNSHLLWEPWQIKNQAGLPYKVFTPYFRKGCLQANEPSRPIKAPTNMTYSHDPSSCQGLQSFNLLPEIDWYQDIQARWQPGEASALAKLKDFTDEMILSSKKARDVPSMLATSFLSPHLHFGEISANTIWHHVIDAHFSTSGDDEHKITSDSNALPEKKAKAMAGGVSDANVDCYLSELVWREFSHYLLYHFPTLPEQNFNTKFDNYPWNSGVNNPLLAQWQQGKTGLPIVDAGMRELWQTGYMHNRVRMIVGSFLVKNLNIHWREGAKWFWDWLLDADLAANSASWQWVAGSGVDAAPFFRIFNPILQGEKFDSEGSYVRQYCPELTKLPNKYIHQPWLAPDEILAKAGIVLGKDYPLPIVDLKASRNAALAAYQQVK